jgi:ribosomal protein S18 acetylase RimI-like enzyme
MPEVSGRYSIRAAAGPGDCAAARALFLEYAAWLQEDLCFQGFEEELATLPGRYAPPDGRLFLAWRDAAAVGCVALRRFDAESGEVKRLYVKPDERGHGLARALTSAVVDAARAIGYRRLVLDTLDRMAAARGLYAAAGFREIPAYYETPICGTRFMALALENGKPET